MRIRFVVGCLVTLIAASDVMAADCITDSHGMVVCGKGQCAPDQYGKVFCAQEGGGAVKNRYGTVMCGVGYCATDNSGEILCSLKPGGVRRSIPTAKSNVLWVASLPRSGFVKLRAKTVDMPASFANIDRRGSRAGDTAFDS